MTPCPRALAAASLFGLSLPDDTAPPPPAGVTPPGPGTITLLTGPSGAGKSSALRDLAARARRTRTVIDLGTIRLAARPAVAHFPGLGAEESMRALAAAGLADARCFIRAPHQLSAGQRWRLILAVALDRARRATSPPLLIADEFAALLDRTTARACARLLRRACDRSRVAAAVATAHDDLAPALAPHRIVAITPGRAPDVTEHCSTPAPIPLRFSSGSFADYAALARFHYRPGRPATIDAVLTARTPAGALLAVLTVSRPTLNSTHRDLAWPRRYTAGTKRARARRLNRELRCLSRVIVDPRVQGLGVARRLVARYLRDPLTPCTEAIAAMGAVSPFFERAGMTAYPLPPAARTARLTDALAHLGLSPADLADSRTRARLARRPAGLLERECRAWAPPRAGALPFRELLDVTAARLTTARTAYAHTHPHGGAAE